MTTVSVLISAFNVEEYIEESVNSILSQTHEDLEIFIVDDGSKDGTYDRIQSFNDPRIISYTQKNKGKAATLNDLLDIAKGKYAVIHDADDISTPDRIECLVSTLEQHQHLALVLSGHALLIDDKVVAPVARDVGEEECKELIEQYKLPGHDPTMMVRTDIARKIRFQDSMSMGQGVDFIFHTAEIYPMRVVGKSLYHYRIHPNSITKRKAVDKAERLLKVMNSARVRRGLEPWTFDYYFENNRFRLEDQDNNLSGHFTESTYLSVMAGERMLALRTAMQSLSLAKKGKRYLKPLVYALAPRCLCEWGRKRFGSC